MVKNIVVLTGAGISAESGLSTFRDEGGLWCQHRMEDVATPEAFKRDPELVHRFYNMRRQQLNEVEPNAAHHALVKLEKHWRGDFLLVTQNVDDLHQRAGSGANGGRIIAMHGELRKVRCAHTDKVFPWEKDTGVDVYCPCCNSKGALRPHIVWFGEIPLEMNAIQHALRGCDIFLSIGTSGTVYPAAGFVQEAKVMHGARTVELNMEPGGGSMFFDEHIHGAASKNVPKYVDKLLAEMAQG